MGLMLGSEIAHEPAARVLQAGLSLKCLVDLQETIIDRPVPGIEDHLYDAETLDERVEQGSVSLLAFMQFLLRLLPPGEVVIDIP